MKKFKVKVTTTFYYEEEVEAETPEEAKKEMEEAISSGEVDAVSDTLDPDTVVRVIENKGDPKKKNGWQVAIDLTGAFEDGTCDQNREMIYSPLFETEDEADEWYRALEIKEGELREIDRGLDIILMYWVDDEIKETWLY